jgi:phosphatidylethanolamine-binding protein (PEBP) family uncharacterized protein
VEISSSAIESGKLASVNTCDGRNTPPSIEWGGIPSNTAELMLDILKLSTVNGKLYFVWAVAGLSPSSHGIAAGSLPAGAVEGVNSSGTTKYSVCPKNGVLERYVAVLFALPKRLGLKPNFDAVAARLEAVQDSEFEGFLPFSYTRG